MTNAEMLSLTAAMGVEAKSQSSTIIEAQADRLRRRAERDGLIRAEQPVEEKPAKRAAAPSQASADGDVAEPAKKAPAKKAPAKKAAASDSNGAPADTTPTAEA